MKTLHLEEGINVLDEERTNEDLFFIVEVDSSSARCPSCRHVDDLPISDYHVYFQIHLNLHKWMSDELKCPVIIYKVYGNN